MEAKERYLALFEQERRGAGNEPAWLRRLREAGIARFAELGFPTTRHEEWKYMDVRPIANLACAPVAAHGEGPHLNGLGTGSIEPFLLNGLDHCRLIFVNGHYSPELSSHCGLPQGVTVASLAAAIADDSELVQQHLGRYAPFESEAFTALNTAFLQDGAFIHIPNGIVIEEPIHLLFVTTSSETPSLTHPRNLILVGDNSQVTLIESYVSPTHDTYFANAVTEIVAGKNAVLDHYKVELESDAAFHIGTMQVQQDRNCNFFSHSFSFGGRLARNNATAVMGGEGIECTLNGLYVVTGEQLIDNHTVMDHAQPHCHSYELYAGVLDGRGRGVFNGKIFVRQDAQKTDAIQSNRSLLLSPDAEVDTKPQLEIFADDVKCTHGATVGQLDEDALFYLCTRGITPNTARDLLTHAFADDIIERVKVEPLRAQLEQELFNRLSRSRQAITGS
ncbi:MAG: Fe-S cluster assembly protein SufD [Armatimonadota bacterium]|nr:Fe-S cluster assembly protein SufD [Armatimonadota bacterium]